jgi:N-acylneuraminate cytidylyltransferase
MKILAIIPARGGSKGVPRKNIKLLGNIPLLAYTINAAKASVGFSEIVVSTEDAEIAIAAEVCGYKPPFMRPAELSQDDTPSIAVVQHAIAFYENQGVFFDAVCLLQPTTPFRPKGFIDQVILKFKASGADSLVSVLPIPHEYNPHWVFEEDQNGLLKVATGEQNIIPRRQELPKAFHRDGAIYLAKTAVVKTGSFFGNSIAYIESDPLLYVNIDTIQDWEKAEHMVHKFNG